MELCGINTDVKGLREFVVQLDAQQGLTLEERGLTAARTKPEPLVLVWHARMKPEESITQLLNADLPAIRGVVFVSAVPYAGMSAEEADQLSAKYERRVHVLSYAIGNVRNRGSCNADISARFSIFRGELLTLAPEASIPWHLLEPPPWPEELVAAYLALVAKDESCDVTGYLTDELWPRAQERATELVTAYGDGSAIDEAVELTDPAKRAAALPALRAIFQRIAEKQSP